MGYADGRGRPRPPRRTEGVNGYESYTRENGSVGLRKLGRSTYSRSSTPENVGPKMSEPVPMAGGRRRRSTRRRSTRRRRGTRRH